MTIKRKILPRNKETRTNIGHTLYTIKKALNQKESVHRSGNIDTVEGIEDREITYPIPFFIRMGVVFISLLILLLPSIGLVGAITFTVNPGESIQEAIFNLPEEGGIVKLAVGTHR